MFNEGKKKMITKNIRFTIYKDGSELYLFSLGERDADSIAQSLGIASGKQEKPIASLTLVGSKSKSQWNQNTDGLVITKPEQSTILFFGSRMPLC